MRPPAMRLPMLATGETRDEKPNGLDGGANASERGDRPHGPASPPLLGLYTTVTNGSNAERPYSAFSEGEKWFIVISSATAAIFSLVSPCMEPKGSADPCRPISSNIYVPAIPTLAHDFDRSNQDITLTVTVYL